MAKHSIFIGLLSNVIYKTNSKDVLLFFSNLTDSQNEAQYKTDTISVSRSCLSGMRLKSKMHIEFKAFIKSIHRDNYYDYHEQEIIELRPTIELSKISEIKIKE